MKRPGAATLGTLALQLFSGLVLAASTRLVQQHSTSSCKGYHASLRCPPKHGIAIRTILYGSHREYCDQRRLGMDHCCAPLVDDCIFSHKAAILSMNTYCSGLDSCYGSSEPTGEMPNHNCGFHLSYIKVDFDCVPDKIVSEFCVDSTYTDSHLYISSAAYPASMSGDNSSCNCLVTAGRDARVNISIQAIDVLFTGFGYRPRSCEQKLMIKSDEEPDENFSLDCNDQKMYGYREVYSSRGNKWLLTLYSHHVADRGRVWLAVKATDNKHRLTVRCGPSVQWKEYQPAKIPGIDESTRRYIGIGILAGCALAVCVFVVLIVTAISWQCRIIRSCGYFFHYSRKSQKANKMKAEGSNDTSPMSPEKQPPEGDPASYHSNTLPQHKPPNSKKGRKASYNTVPRNMESRKSEDIDPMKSFRSTDSFSQAMAASSQQEFLPDYGVPPPPPSGLYENICMSSATFPRGRPLVHDPYAQYYASIQPRTQGSNEARNQATSTPWEPYEDNAVDEEEWPPPYVPEESPAMENTGHYHH